MRAKVVTNARLIDEYEYYLMEVEAKGVAKGARPGQFYMLRVWPGTDPLLRRPFCLHRVVSPDRIRFLYKAGGYGTRLMSRMTPGEEIDVLGPLGNGFRVGKAVNHALLVAGGIGVAPLMGLADYLARERKDVTRVCFIGGRGRDDVLGIKELRKLGIKIYVSTEDGSVPRKGYITDSLEEYIRKYARHGTKGWEIYSCGPKPMLVGVAALAKRHGIKNYASLESNMACGVGACVGCVVSVLDEEHGTAVYKKVCEDGPVFDTESLLWG